jgi:proline iminopeptidase
MTSTSWPAPQFLSTSAVHRIAFRVAGERSGAPWLLLHGGPGAACQPGMLSPLDLKRQWAVAPDQRGCGASLPRGSIARNTTQALVSDLEALRRSLGVQRWSVLAGSWGTVVALAYAHRYPQHVDRLVLRGAFALTRRELAGLLQPSRRLISAVGFEPRWPRAPGYGVPSVLMALRKVVQSGTLGVAGLRAVRLWNRLEMACALQGMRKSLRHAEAARDSQLARRIRANLAATQRGLRRARAQAALPRVRPVDRRMQAKFGVQGHYLAHKGFVRPGELDRAVRRMAAEGIAVDWVHGRFDAVCPVRNSLRWASMAAVEGQGLKPRLQLTGAGHLGHEPATLDALRKVVRAAGRTR